MSTCKSRLAAKRPKKVTVIGGCLKSLIRHPEFSSGSHQSVLQAPFEIYFVSPPGFRKKFGMTYL